MARRGKRLTGVIAENKKYDIFISYRRKDEIFVKTIYDELDKLGYMIFWDRQLGGGTFPNELEEAIKSSSDFLLIITSNTFTSEEISEDDWIRNEIRVALENNINIVPVFYEGAFPAVIPDDISKVGDYNGIRIFNILKLESYIKEIHERFLKSRPTKKAISRQGSIYSPTFLGELRRLELQAENSIDTDAGAIQFALADVDESKPLNVLDVGCAYGFVGKSRFADDRFINVVGIDRDDNCITYAKQEFEDDKFSYYKVDVVADFLDQMEKIKTEKGIEGFDIVFIALVLHHLGSAVPKVLRDIRKIMSRDGIIILRSSDDGSKLAYNDDGLMENIIQLTKQAKGISDRFNGRKLFGYLLNAGFKDIKIKSYMRDTVSFDVDQLQDLFDESFSYRIRYFEQLCKNEPENKEYQRNYYKMEEMLEEFELKFHEKSFWYCEYDYVGIARK